MKAKEDKEKSGNEAAEKKAKAAQEAALKKKELQRKKEEEKAEKQEAAAAAKAAKEKEKLKRARRAPEWPWSRGGNSPLTSPLTTCVLSDPRNGLYFCLCTILESSSVNVVAPGVQRI